MAPLSCKSAMLFNVKFNYQPIFKTKKNAWNPTDPSILKQIQFLFYFPSPNIPFIIDCNNDNITLKNRAVQKVSTLNPPTIFVHNSIISALITNKNNPNVRIVTGNVKITIIGLIKMFSNPNTIATKNAVVKLAT